MATFSPVRSASCFQRPPNRGKRGERLRAWRRFRRYGEISQMANFNPARYFPPRIIGVIGESQWIKLQDMPTDNDNEGPGLGLGDLNDIFNDDPFSNAGAESPTGDHHHHHDMVRWHLLSLKLHQIQQNKTKKLQTKLQVPIQGRRERERRGTRKVNCLEAILPSGWRRFPNDFVCFFVFVWFWSICIFNKLADQAFNFVISAEQQKSLIEEKNHSFKKLPTITIIVQVRARGSWGAT